VTPILKDRISIDKKYISKLLLKQMANYLDIDLEIEKLVFLENAFEGNPGIYELTWELGHFALTIEDKYKIAHELLVVLLTDELVTLEKFEDLNSSKSIETVDLKDVEVVLNNPANWYPCNEVYSIRLTEKGEEYLNRQSKLLQQKLQQRIFGQGNK
jgi:hypothetical protein